MANTAGILVLLACCITLCVSYSTSGNRILDPSGNQVVLRGVARPTLEWSPVGEHLSLADYQLIKNWGSNVVRIGLSQCFWLSGCNHYDPNYIATVDQQVKWIKSLGMGVILDLHWSNKGSTGTDCGQQTMPDNISTTFWLQVATKYKNDPWVMFEIYNEPYGVSWSVWKNGGDAGGFQTPGMQGLVNSIRGTGANNVLIIGGLNYAFDLSGVAANLIVGTNIVYNTHPYNFGGKQPADWRNAFGYLTPNYPVIATEFGVFDCSTDYINQWIAYADANCISWTAWGWYVNGCAFPSLITDWNGTPAANAVPVKASLAKNFKCGTAGTATTAATVASATTKAATTTTTTTTGGSSASIPVYSDSVLSPFSDWSWADGRNAANSNAQSGTKSYSVAPGNYQSVYFSYVGGINTNVFKSIDFYVNFGTGNPNWNFAVVKYSGTTTSIVTPDSPVSSYCAAHSANQWVKCSVPLSQYPANSVYDGFWFQDKSGGAPQSTVYVDTITLIAK